MRIQILARVAQWPHGAKSVCTNLILVASLVDAHTNSGAGGPSDPPIKMGMYKSDSGGVSCRRAHANSGAGGPRAPPSELCMYKSASTHIHILARMARWPHKATSACTSLTLVGSLVDAHANYGAGGPMAPPSETGMYQSDSGGVSCRRAYKF